MTARKYSAKHGDALLVVDIQNDFLPGGALGVADGDAVIAPLNRLINDFSTAGLPVIISRDWHPSDHCSFSEHGGPWPRHCVAGTPGAEFSPALATPEDAIVVSKATETMTEAYSALQGTGLADRLREAEVTRVFIGGLATDYCVRATVLDLVAAGFEAVTIEDATRAVDVEPGDGVAALRDIVAAGGRLAQSENIDTGVK